MGHQLIHEFNIVLYQLQFVQTAFHTLHTFVILRTQEAGVEKEEKKKDKQRPKVNEKGAGKTDIYIMEWSQDQ